MTSRTSFCNGTLFSKTLRRFWPLWAAYLVIWLLTLPLGLHTALTNPSDVVSDAVLLQRQVYSVTRYGGLLLCFGMAPIAAMAVFSGLYEEKRAGVFASLPIRREASFGAFMLAGLLPLLAAHLLAAAAAALIALGKGCFLWTPFLTYLGITTLYTLCFYGFAVFCAQLTGQLLIVPAVYGVLEFTAPALELLIRWLLSLFLYGFEGGDITVGEYFSPFTALFRHTAFFDRIEGTKTVGVQFRGWPVALICAASGVVLLAAALLLYRKRRTESAGDTVAVKPLKKVFSCALGVGCALVLSAILATFFGGGNLMKHRTAVVGAGFLLGGFIGYFGAEMLMRKSFRVFGACLRGGAILLAGLMLLLGAMRFDVLGLERRLPPVGKIESVQLHTAKGETAELGEPESIEKALELNRYVLEHREGEDKGAYLRVRYKLKSGSYTHFYRQLPEEDAELAKRLEELYNSDEAIRGRIPREVDRHDFHFTEVQFQTGEATGEKTDYRSVEVTAEEAYEWYTTCIWPDVEEGTLGRVYFDEKTAPQTYNVECWLEIYRDAPPEERSFAASAYRPVQIRPTVGSTRTNEWLTAHGVELHLMPEE